MSQSKMAAALFYGPRDMRVEEVDKPRVNAGELLIKVEVTLTCGTDVKMYRRGHTLTSKLPMIIGHEFAGVVEAMGDGVKGFQVGMRVAAANSAPCNLCFFCKRGNPNLCEQVRKRLIGFSVQGAYAEYVVVPETIVKQNTHIIPSHCSFREAALLEPLSCVVHGNELAGIALGDTVVVMGAGPIGLLHMKLAKIRGAGEVVAVDLVNSRLEDARDFGADCTVNPREGGEMEKVKELTAGRGADVVIEAVGLPETWAKAVEMTRKGGIAVLFGGCPADSIVALPTEEIHYGELTVRGVFHHTPWAVERAFRLICTGAVKAEQLITDTMPLRDVNKALEMMGEGRSSKVAIIPKSG